MAIVVTKLSPNPRQLAPGMNMLEFSVTLPTSWTPTTGASLGFGTNTNFKSKVFWMMTTKGFRDTNNNFLVELRQASSTTETASTAKIQVRCFIQTSNTNKTVKTRMCTTARDLKGVKGRILVAGY